LLGINDEMAAREKFAYFSTATLLLDQVDEERSDEPISTFYVIDLL